MTIITGTDFYTPGPCQPYEYISRCTIPTGSEALTGYALEIASEIIYYLSGQRFDSCQITIRPCRKSCGGNDWPFISNSWWEVGSGIMPAKINGAWYNLACGMCGDSCSCTMISETILPGPVQRVVQVVVDGVALTADVDYRLDDYRKLVRLGGAMWPLCNDFNKSLTEVGTWGVTAIYGEPLPTLGKLAVGELFCEVLNDLIGDDCSLPSNVTEVVRQGLTMTLESSEEAAQDGFTGLKWVDRFIQTYNPTALRARPQMYDLDAPTFRVTGTTIT